MSRLGNFAQTSRANHALDPTGQEWFRHHSHSLPHFSKSEEERSLLVTSSEIKTHKDAGRYLLLFSAFALLSAMQVRRVPNHYRRHLTAEEQAGPEVNLITINPSERGVYRLPDENFEELFMDLLFSLKEEPVEDGMSHEGEKIIGAILKEHDEVTLADRTSGIESNSTRASVMRLMGRVPIRDTWVRRKMVSEGLASQNIQIRDAAMQMVEDWEDPECVDLLKSHKEPVDWLDKYVQDIIEDIEG